MNVNDASVGVVFISGLTTVGILDNPTFNLNAFIISASTMCVAFLVLLKTQKEILDVEIINDDDEQTYYVRRGGSYCDNPYYK